jgi:hypothetical protein
MESLTPLCVFLRSAPATGRYQSGYLPSITWSLPVVVVVVVAMVAVVVLVAW